MLYIVLFMVSFVNGALYPSVSPDGSKISFSYYGDIWVAPSSGGEARRITDSKGYEGKSLWSPDGKWIAFQSDRYGNDDIFIISVDGGTIPRRLTFFSNYDQILFWSDNSKYIYFFSYRTEKNGGVYRVSIEGGNPEKVFNFRVLNASKIPNSDLVIFERGGTRWWRKRYRGSANHDIWIGNIKDNTLKRITNFKGRDAFPMYSSVTKKIYFISNDNPQNIDNLFEMGIEGNNKKQLTNFSDEIYFPSISYNGKLIAFVVMGKLYTYDISSGKTEKIQISVPEDYKTREIDYRVFTRNASEFALSPDESEIAFVVFGDIFIMELKNGKPGKIKRITDTPEPEKDVNWNPNMEEIIFSSLKDGDWDIYSAEPMRKKKFYKDYSFKIVKILDTPVTEKKAKYSPDGKKIAFIQNRGELNVMDANGKNLKKLYPENDILWIDWSPDSKWIAFSRTELGWREDIFVVPADGSKEAVNISDHPNDDYKPMWSSDGRRISFASRTADGDLWIKYVFLRKEDEEKDIEYWEQKKDSLKLEGPVKIDFDGIKDRIHTVAKFRGGYNYWTQSSDGMVFAIQAENLNSNDLWTVDWFGKNLKRLTKGNVKPDLFFVTNDKKSVFYLSDGGTINEVDIGSGNNTPVSFRVGVDVVKKKLREALFKQAWWILDDGFYDPNFHGTNWKEMYSKYDSLAANAREDRDFHNFVRMMLGELNASHLGIWKNEERGAITGCLGIIYDSNYKGSGVKVKKVIKNSPADEKTVGIKAGDIITAVDGRTIAEGDNFYKYLLRKNNKKVLITYLRGGKKKIEKEVKLISPWKLWGIVNKNWVDNNRKFVEKESKGKLGYIYIQSMGTSDLVKFEKDLYEIRDKEGLVLDIRYNGGGRIHDELLNILRRTVYGYSVERGENEKEYNSLFRWDKPIVLLINEFCYSDAEIFPMGFKQLKLGKLVGTPTFGAVIGTNDRELMDGTIFREPSEGWYRLSGLSLENNPVYPDVYIENPPEYDNRSDDPQLKKAIDILMKGIK